MLGLSFRKVGPGYLLHDNAPAHSSGFVSEFLTKQGIPMLSHPPYSPDLAPADFFLFPKLKIVMNEIQGCFIDPADCDERTEGDMRRNIFSGI
jgi:transposase